MSVGDTISVGAYCLGKWCERETQVAVLEQFRIRDVKMPAFSVSTSMPVSRTRYKDRSLWA
jgi:hypothetical protein